MGSSWSLATKQKVEERARSTTECRKRQRLSFSYGLDHPQLIPGLPDEISLHTIARVPRGCHSTLRLVNRAWKAALTSQEVFVVRKEQGLTEEWLYILTKDEEDSMIWYALDPLTGIWRTLPSMPELKPEEEPREVSRGGGWLNAIGSSGNLISSLLKGWYRRKTASKQTPLCGCSAAVIEGSLYVLGGFSRTSALRCVWKYDPRYNKWSQSAAMGTARAFCKTGLINNKLYVVGGVNTGRGGLIPLLSGEVYEPVTNTWSPIPNMPFTKTQVLPTAFLADMLKPIATGMAAFNGHLWVPQSLYSWPIFVDIGGEVYDPESKLWKEMPRGMGEGWPARQAGTKLSVIVNGHLYSLDPTSTVDGSKVKVYDFDQDTWKIVFSKVPVLLDLTESESPYLLACLRGGFHIVTKDINDNVTVLRADLTRPASPDDSTSSEADDERWINISTSNFGSLELIACQVLDV
ncbi:hypothetical protein O6H91_09G055000 [Diphasiastrum complanatum]|uniref:Uncharacterized protein n=1 Tax=Diphasiastrum complanatum TaxID=34168 RepID=A0ACC2CP81_DIPCM|nr:hypothetical protein O6H91_09G055000 [Diphasiastrum complanatum]